jgi:hypothetical protein
VQVGVIQRAVKGVRPELDVGEGMPEGGGDQVRSRTNLVDEGRQGVGGVVMVAVVRIAFINILK